jgi:glutaredoxin-dependent peroxiredoxin
MSFPFSPSAASWPFSLTPTRSPPYPLFPPHQVSRPSLRKLTVMAAKTVSVGDKIPDSKLNYFDAEGNMKEMTLKQLCEGKKVILFAVPGAFTPTCSLKHLPGFIEKADEIKKKGVDTIACVSVNDAFVMDAWGKAVGADDKVLMLADGSAAFTKAIGAELDLNEKVRNGSICFCKSSKCTAGMEGAGGRRTAAIATTVFLKFYSRTYPYCIVPPPQGLGLRSRRYAMLVDNMEVKALNLEEGGAFTVSSAEDILKAL